MRRVSRETVPAYSEKTMFARAQSTFGRAVAGVLPLRQKSFALTLIAAGVAALGAAAFNAPAFADPGLSGAWNGSGSVMLPSGATEKARCKATFRKRGAAAYAMDAVCASTSAKVTQTASLDQVGPNRFAGDFTNAEFNVSGSINVTIKGNSLNASLSGGGATATFNLSR
jgi:hypothetical protein